MEAAAAEDERQEELTTINAIFPELVLEDDFVASIDLPIAPSKPLAVRFAAERPPSPPTSEDGKPSALLPDLHHTHLFEHLPPLHLRVTLPEGYPQDEAPRVSLATTPEWLPGDKLQELEEACEKLWEEFGRCQILFSYIDLLQQEAERAFDLDAHPLSLPPTLEPALVDYDATTKKRIFDAGTYDCGICLEPKKGSSCYRMRRCAHVFCLACLQDFYNNCITEGDVQRVQCLDPTCGKDSANPRKRKREKTLHPRELLAMGIDDHMVRRYVEMKRKKALEADKTTVYCPRTWCQAPARSDKYPPIPADLSQYPDSDTDADTDSTTLTKAKISPADRLAVCSKCRFAFCKTCYAGWHGEFARCWPRNPAELSEEEKASYDYIRLHTSPCPTCSSPTQKTMGCNHMRCFQCGSHFCYLCGAWLDGENPYQHFNKGGSSCYMRLWDLEEGDEGNDGGGDVRFEGPRRWEAEARAVAEAADREEAEQLQREEDARAAQELAAQLQRDGGPAVGPIREAGQQQQQQQQQAQAPPAPPQQVDPAAAAAAAAFRRFVELAVRDEEEDWDSDELEGNGDEEWEIRAR